MDEQNFEETEISVGHYMRGTCTRCKSIVCVCGDWWVLCDESTDVCRKKGWEKTGHVALGHLWIVQIMDFFSYALKKTDYEKLQAHRCRENSTTNPMYSSHTFNRCCLMTTPCPVPDYFDAIPEFISFPPWIFQCLFLEEKDSFICTHLKYHFTFLKITWYHQILS